MGEGQTLTDPRLEPFYLEPLLFEIPVSSPNFNLVIETNINCSYGIKHILSEYANVTNDQYFVIFFQNHFV